MAEAANNPVTERRGGPDYERVVTLRNLRVGCYLVILLMPAGSLVDYFVYREALVPFLLLRIACSALLAGILPLLATEFGKRHTNALALAVALLPAFFMCSMIALEEGSESPYYAALNLILLAIAFVMRWSVGLSVFALGNITLAYIAACLFHDGLYGLDRKMFVNNLYFVGLTGIIVVTGSLIHRRLRQREAALSQQLERSNEELARTVDQLRATQDQLVESEKKRALGVLAGGIIHDIGNTLNHINTNLFVLKKRCAQVAPEQKGPILDLTGDLDRGVKQALNTVQRVRQYTHPNTELLEQVEVADVVESALLFTSSRWKEGQVQVERKIEPGQTVWANKHNLVDLLTNLLVNSIDALATKTSFGDGESPAILIEGLTQNGRSIVRVRDNGPGIPPENQSRVFDPYFTTKDVGEGTGLGLSTCQRIVRQYGGEISLKSEPGRFCEFALEFPMKP